MARTPTELAEAVGQLRALVLASVRYRRRLATELGVGETEINAMGYLRTLGELTPRELADLLDLTSGSITGLVDRLESAGFITRKAHPTDRRRLLVRLTPAGTHAIDWMFDRFTSTLIDGLEDVEVEADVLTAAFGGAADSIRRAIANPEPGRAAARST